jgi:hypothetical protein
MVANITDPLQLSEQQPSQPYEKTGVNTPRQPVLLRDFEQLDRFRAYQ